MPSPTSAATPEGRSTRASSTATGASPARGTEAPSASRTAASSTAPRPPPSPTSRPVSRTGGSRYGAGPEASGAPRRGMVSTMTPVSGGRAFQDRVDAGRVLAQELRPYAGRPDVVVLGLPRG